MRKICLFIVLSIINSLNLVAQKATAEQWNNLIYCIEEHESNHKENVKSPNGLYWGPLQIAKVCVDGCNKIIGHKHFTYADRLNREKSYEMFNIVQDKYNPDHDMCLAVRLWAAGLVALKNKNAGMKQYREVMVIYRKHFGNK